MIREGFQTKNARLMQKKIKNLTTNKKIKKKEGFYGK